MHNLCYQITCHLSVWKVGAKDPDVRTLYFERREYAQFPIGVGWIDFGDGAFRIVETTWRADQTRLDIILDAMAPIGPMEDIKGEIAVTKEWANKSGFVLVDTKVGNGDLPFQQEMTTMNPEWIDDLGFEAAHQELIAIKPRAPHWNGRGYAWYNENRPKPSDAVPDEATLPEGLYGALLESMRRNRQHERYSASGRWIAFPSVESAMEALACARSIHKEIAN